MNFISTYHWSPWLFWLLLPVWGLGGSPIVWTTPSIIAPNWTGIFWRIFNACCVVILTTWASGTALGIILA